MRKSLLTLFCALCALFLVPNTVKAADYTIEPKADGAEAIKSRAIPLRYDASSVWGSVSQQIYLASELTGEGASAGNINAITFYYSASSNIDSNPSARDIQIFLMQIPAEQNAFVVKDNGKSDFLYVSSTNKTAGTRVYNGALTTEAVTTLQTKTVKINFDNSFPWDGSSNLVLTVFDMSATSNTVADGGFANIRFLISKTETARFLSKKWYSSDTDNRSAWIADISNNVAGREGEYWTSSASPAVATQTANRSYVNKVTFSIVTPVPVPTSPSAGSITANSAVLSWIAAAGADSYEVRYGTTSGSLGAATNVGNVTSYSLSELTDETTYYYQIRTKKGSEYSAWTDEASFTTSALAPHTHDNITFTKWTSTNSLPSEAGNYYLNADVTLSNHYSVPGNINLCLNGHSIYTDIYNIVVSDNKTLAIYDNVGGGRIYGYYVGTNSSYYGLVSIADGGTFVLNGGSVENLANDFNNALEVSYGIYNNATLKLSGDHVITGYHGDIYLAYSRLITIESGKPLTNSTPYSIYKATIGPITDGWANMSGANPSAFFTSKEESFGVCYNSSTGEAELVRVFSTSDNNASIKTALEDGTYQGRLVNFKITSRSFTSESFNTICLPFALSNAQLEDVFGAGYDLEEFVSSSLDGDVLALEFNKVTSLVAGKPYLLQPSIDVVNPVFNGVIFHISEPGSDESDANIYFYGTFGPTSLEGGNKNLLFLGANDELFWPEATGNIKGFRAYFSVREGSAARRAIRACINTHKTPTGIENQKSQITNQKFLKDGQLFIIRDNKTYNVLGIECK